MTSFSIMSFFFWQLDCSVSNNQDDRNCPHDSINGFESDYLHDGIPTAFQDKP